MARRASNRPDPRPAPRAAGAGPSAATARASREVAFAALCHLDALDEGELEGASRLLWQAPPVDDERTAPTAALTGPNAAEVRARAEPLVARFLARRGWVDGLIREVSTRWRLERLDRVERAILRLAVTELEAGGAPVAVVIAEATRIAATYGTERSARFVNGVLAQALERITAQKAERP